jgi:phytoene dehydrogenase-like protein
VPSTLDQNYDGIIIGAGHHGLILGSYLAKAGLNILLVERRLRYGGGLSTEEVTQPGFYHNLHSINHFHISEAPWFKDLGLHERVGYITPRYEFGQAHRDGTALVLGRDLDETVANIARFSKRDAETFREWNRKAERITAQIFIPERYAEPLPQAERDALLSRTALGREFLEVAQRQPLDVVKELFENEHVQLLFLFKVSLFGTWLVDTLSKTSPMGSVIRAFDLESGYQLCQGGSFNLARGLMETFIAAGGRYQPQAAIERILIEGGAARGIALADGRTVRANFVASTLDVHQTFETLIGREQLPEEFRRKLDGFQYTAWALYGLHLALHESPRFAAASFDPHIDRALKWSIGAETMQDLFEAHQDVQAGRIPKLIQFGSGPLSLLDPSQAPPGKHTTYAARDAAQSGPRSPELPGFQGGICRPDYRDMGAVLPEHDEEEHHRTLHLHRARIRAGTREHAERRHIHGRLQCRAGDVQPFRLSHADTQPLQCRLGRASGWRDFRGLRLHQCGHHRARPRPQAMVDTLGCAAGPGGRAASGVNLLHRSRIVQPIGPHVG